MRELRTCRRSCPRSRRAWRPPSCGTALQLHAGAAVVEAGLVDLDAACSWPGGSPRRAAGICLAGLAVVDHDLAGEQLGHAGGVVLDDELLQLDRERQVLQQRCRRTGSGSRCSTACPRAPACCRGRSGCSAAGGAPAARRRSCRRRCRALLPSNQHLRAHDQVAVEQAAHAHQHDGAVRRDVAELVGARRPWPPPSSRAVASRCCSLTFQPPPRQRLADALGRGLGRFGQRRLGPVVEGLQALLADVFLVGLQVGQDLAACCARCTARC